MAMVRQRPPVLLLLLLLLLLLCLRRFASSPFSDSFATSVSFDYSSVSFDYSSVSDVPASVITNLLAYSSWRRCGLYCVCFQLVRCVIFCVASTESGQCFVILIGDKGHPSVANLIADGGNTDPYLAKHGSVSVSVNFHTFTTLFQRHVPNGFALLPDPSPRCARATSIRSFSPQ
jgi:hypothetical protein